MRRLLYFLLIAVPALGQLPPPTFTYVTVAPSGACVGTPPIQIVYFTGAAYVCANGQWATLGGTGGGGGGTGTVLSFSASALSPLFTVGVTNSTTTPALSFTLSPVAANSVYAGPASGGSGPPSFQLAPTVSAANMTNFPTFNQNTTGSAASAALAAEATVADGLQGSPAITVSNLTDSALTSGNCVQAGTGGMLTTTGAACGSGGGSSITIDTNSVSNSNQGLLNFTTTGTIAFTNPSGGVESAAIVSPGANTVLGFNGSNAYTGFTAGAGISLAGGQITNTSPGTISGTLASGNIPVGTGTSTLGTSHLADNGTTLSYTGTGGFNPGPGGITASGTTPAILSVAAGTGSIAALATNSAGFAAPVSGGTSYLFKLPGTITQGFLFAATPAPGDGVNESALTVGSPEFTLSAGTANYGQYASGTLIASAKMTRAGHFENLEIANVSGSCAAGSVVNVHDLSQVPTYQSITTVGPTFTDSAGNVWSLASTSGGQVVINGETLTSTNNVIQMVYVYQKVWQLNNSGNWYEVATITGTPPTQTVTFNPPTTTSPIASTVGIGVAGPTTGSIGGVFADQAQTLSWAAGDRIAIMVDLVGTAPCTGNFTVNATAAEP